MIKHRLVANSILSSYGQRKTNQINGMGKEHIQIEAIKDAWTNTPMRMGLVF